MNSKPILINGTRVIYVSSISLSDLNKLIAKGYIVAIKGERKK